MLSERMGSRQGLELRHDPNVLTELDLGGELLLDSLEPEAPPSGDLARERRLVREVRQRAASPERALRKGSDPWSPGS